MSNDQKYIKFQMEEAQWLDSIVRPFIPQWVKWLVEKNNRNIFGRFTHFLIDVFYINKILGIKIKRNQDTVILGGKGFRQGINHGYKIANIHTTVTKRKVEIAKQKFIVDIVIKN